MIRLLLLALFLTVPTNAFATEAEEPEAQSRIEEAFDDKTEVAPDPAYGAYQRGMYLTAFELALPRAEAGDAAAQTLIAELYDLGQGVARDSEKAAQWYKVAALSGNREAKFAYGLRLLQGRDFEQDVKEGIRLMAEAADAGHPLAMFNYATHLISQRPTTAGYRKALPYLERAADHRLADAYYLLAGIYREGLATGIGNPEKARTFLERAAQAGVNEAQVELGIAYATGTDGPKDLAKANSWYLAAARNGNVIAQNRLAHQLFAGLGVQKNITEAAMWHILASRAGRADPVLDEYMRTMDEKSRSKALSMANKWPF